MEISSFSPDEGDRFGPRTLSDVSIASNASGKSHSGVGVRKHVKDAKVKFLCSYGGKILPRPSDKKLRYVGGETRVISVPRHIHFLDLLIKMADIYGPDIALRYQLPDEDLDALVSVSSDEDLQNMMDECDRLNAIEGSSRLRVFAFSSSDLDATGLRDISDLRISEQHYVDAVNTVQREVSMKRTEDAAYFVGMFQSQALPFDRNLHSGIFPLLSQELKNDSDLIASPIHETDKLWKELAVNQNPNIENLVDVEAGGSAGSSISSQHDVYHKCSNNQSRFPISQDLSYLESRPFGNDVDGVYTHGQEKIEDKIKMQRTQDARFDLDDHIYVQEVASNEMENIHGRVFPLSPGARLQRQLEVNQRKALEPSLNGDQMYNPVKVFVQEQLFTGGSIIKQDPVNTTLPGADDLFQHQGPWLVSQVAQQAQLSEEIEQSSSKLFLKPNIALDQETRDATDYSLQAFSPEVTHGIKNEIDISGKNVLHEFEHEQKRSPPDLSSLLVSANNFPDEVFHELRVADKQQVAGGLSLLDELVQLEVVDTIPEFDRDVSSAALFIDSDAPSVQDINHLNEAFNSGDEALISIDLLLDTKKFDASPAREFDVAAGVAQLSVARNSTQDIFGLSYDLKSLTKNIVDEDSDTPTVVEEFFVKKIPFEDEYNIQAADTSQAPPLSWTLPGSDLPLELENDVSTEDQRSEIEMETFMTANDMPVNAAAAAEAEAIARGLQTIHNCDLEELRELGSGTFGTVYHGKWRGTDVAIKRIKSSCFTGRPAERERLIADFWQEACILGQLHHPNVVAFYGVVPDGPNETLATVTEYMVNGSLKQSMLKRDRSLDLRKRLLIAMDAAFGMEYLHGKNVVHFDLKCENLLVNLRDTHRPICKVGDLGLSKVKQQTMISGGVRGTLPWMAPELLNGSSSLVSEKVDVFSFGIVLWELLTGEEPYANMHYGAIIGGIVSNTLRPPIPKWCDAAWKSLMERCWSANPAERPTFSEIARNLREMEATYTAKKQGQTPPLSG